MSDIQKPNAELFQQWEAAIFGAELGSAPSIDLHGMDVHDATQAVEHFINQGFMAGDQVIEIIHGKGTGVLRAAVHETLKNNPLVEYFREAQSVAKTTAVTYAVLARRT